MTDRSDHADATEEAKRAAAEEAAADVADGMTVGLGTGTTVAHLLPVLASRHLRIRCVATSPATAAAGRRAGLEVVPFEGIDRLDLAIDGADQVDPDGWLVKGGGAAHTREKIVAAAATRFVVIVSPEKLVDALHPPLPVEVLAFGLSATLRHLPDLRIRRDTPPSPDGGVICDWFAPLDDPRSIGARLDAVPGVVAHGLFPAELVSEVVIGRPDGAERRQPAR